MGWVVVLWDGVDVARLVVECWAISLGYSRLRRRHLLQGAYVEVSLCASLVFL